ncbi:MAG: DUF302 domain-containing protein [Gammaproteobacteria bacterium]|nr:DUF302 domain-containing protein [Gammaproteobacteria bacterium]
MYGMEVIIKGTMQEAEQKTIEALKTEGFGVLTEIDVQATLKNKINIDRAPYKILGACNPKIANDVLNIEPDVGLLLPCNVVIREVADNQISVSLIDPEAMFTVVNNDKVKDKVSEVKAKFVRIQKLIEA